MYRVCYTNVSDIALCQRCPALLGYKIHMHEKDAWRECIKGKGFPYGSMFHRNIAQVFFEAASDSHNRLHEKLARSISGGAEALEEFIREDIFMPFIERNSVSYSPEQLIAAAEGADVWVKAMWEFFSEIPSLMKNPVQNMSTVFLQPEQKLRAFYDFPDEGRLIVTGCYDALMFNPDKAEARLFEFKGYSKSDATGPLSQSVMYAWMIEKFSGIVPSVEIIYLDEEEKMPDIFDPVSVKCMIASGLPGLFYSAFNTITLRRLPEIMKDKNFCGTCRFRKSCDSDWAARFRKRKGASLVNVMVFMLAAAMIMTQTFFFLTLSYESDAVHVESMHKRLKFDHALTTAIEVISSDTFKPNDVSYDIAFIDYSKFKASFDKINLGSYSSDDIGMDIYDMFYSLKNFDADSVAKYVTELNKDEASSLTEPNKLFPAIIPEAGGRYFMVRIYDKNTSKNTKLMYQALIRRDKSRKGPKRAKVISFQEVWY